MTALACPSCFACTIQTLICRAQALLPSSCGQGVDHRSTKSNLMLPPASVATGTAAMQHHEQQGSVTMILEGNPPPPGVTDERKHQATEYPCALHVCTSRAVVIANADGEMPPTVSGYLGSRGLWVVVVSWISCTLAEVWTVLSSASN